MNSTKYLEQQKANIEAKFNKAKDECLKAVFEATQKLVSVQAELNQELSIINQVMQDEIKDETLELPAAGETTPEAPSEVTESPENVETAPEVTPVAEEVETPVVTE